MSDAWLADLKNHFATSTTLLKMNKVSNKYVKCAMCLPKSNRTGGTEWFMLRWNNLSPAQQEYFRYYIGEKVLHLKSPGMFCVDILEGAKQVVVFYIASELQKLADVWFHERPLPRYRLEDALATLHNAQPTDWPFTNQAYDVAASV